MKTILLAAGLAAVVATAAVAQQAPAVRDLAVPPALKSPPASLLPTSIGGAVVYVRDLEAQRKWYETMLGFKVQTTYSRGGKVFEHIMGTGNGGAFMGLMQSDARPAGSNTNSRIVVPVPNPKALADYMATQGIYVREAVPGSAYFILDPEGNQVELYRLSAPAPAAPARK